MIKPLLFAVAAFALATPVVASPLGGALSASQNATNNQNNTGSVIQAPSGGSQTNDNEWCWTSHDWSLNNNNLEKIIKSDGLTIINFKVF